MHSIARYRKTSTILNVETEIASQGEVCNYHVHYSGIPEFTLAMTLPEIGLAVNYMRHAAARMIRAKAAELDRGKSVLLDVAEIAVVPTKLDVVLHPRTGDRTILVQSADNAPIGIKLTPFETEMLVQRLGLIKKLGNN